jgi:hypothetical protein
MDIILIPGFWLDGGLARSGAMSPAGPGRLTP